ncbi:Threonine/homoserine/homoserine lactone efflux protein [Prauserella aidingensis]|uniref:LysE family translocator n=1 Tax=Prauserella aidingensis TaxID=387890 RepID=UPI0020A61AA6|nr:LysE family translocator [Prauserella aidingensis]MCP2251485.1 Threonine/homoserine/homoserine lactone efflux protein [Prauserella aidingensis]
MSTAFLVTALVIVATPGTGALYTIGTGLARGTKAGILAAFACTLGTVPHLVAAITGLATVLQASGLAFAVIKYAGVAYLLYMAWATWRERGAMSVDAGDSKASARTVICSGVTLNLLNPKLTIFFFAFLPQFVPDGNGATATMLGLSAVFMLMTFVVFAAYGMFAAAMRDHVLTRPRVVAAMRKLFAATFVALAGRLAVQSR